MVKAFLSIILLLAGNLAVAQTTVLHGRVLDSADSSALVGTTVVADGRLNTMCDVNGYFTLRGVPRSVTSIQCVMLGYKTATITFKSTSSKTELGAIYLLEEQNQIDAVIVKSDAPMSIQKGDTTQFNAAAFKTNPDADADELLMKMPGVIIQNGKIEAQGEPIRKIYVDGRLFFGTDPMAALKNLPADAIESIQLFDEPTEQARLTGFEDGETNKAINIVTKSKANKSTIMKMESSAGVDTQDPNKMRYLIGGNFSRFTETDRITITAIANNVNTMKFGQNEMGSDQNVDSNGNITGQPSGVRTVNAVGVNYSRDTKKMRFSGSYFFDDNTNNSERYSELNYYANHDKKPFYDSKSTNSFSQSTNKSNNNRLNFRLEWKPNDKNTFILSPTMRLQNNSTESLRESFSIQDGDSLNRKRDRSPNETNNFALSGEALYSRRFEKRGRSISLGLKYSLSNAKSDRYQKYEMDDTYKSKTGEWVPKDPDKLNNRLIDQNTTGNLVRLKLTYAEPFARYHRILFNYTMSRDWGGSNRQNNKYDKENLDYNIKDTMQCNYFERDYNTIGVGLGYGFYRKNYTLNAGVDYQRLDQTRESIEPYVSQTKFTFYDYQPSVSFKYSLQKSKYIKIQYRGRTDLPRIDQMQNVIDYTSPSNIRIGNPDLEEGYRHSLTAFYNATNIKKSTNLTVMLSATTISNFIASTTESMPIDRDTVIFASEQDRNDPSKGYTPDRGAFVHRLMNLDGYVSSRMSATYSFAIKPIKSNMNLSVDYNYIRTPSFYGTLNYANINSGGIRVGLTSNISENIDFNIYSNTAFNYTRNTTKINTSFLNQNVFLSTNIIFLKDFVFNSVFTWKYYNSSAASDGSNSYYLWNVGLGKKMFKRNAGEFRITAYDLLSQNKNLQHYVRNNAIEDVRTNTIGRYILARFSYRFNSMVNTRKNDVTAGREVKTMSVKEFKKSERNSGK